MANLFNPMLLVPGGIPQQGMQLLLDYPTTLNTTKSYVNMAATGSGTSGTTSITASGTITNLLQPGMKLRIGGTDIYTVSTASVTAITTVETLTNTYVASAMALDRISQWNDTSGRGNHVTRASGLTCPVFNPNKLNGRAVATGDGVSSFDIPSTLFTIPNGANTLFVVANTSDTGNIQRMLYMRNASAAGYSLLYHSASSTAIRFLNAASGTPFVTLNATKTNFNIFMGRRSGTTEAIAVNNGVETSDTNATSDSGVTSALLMAGNAGTTQQLFGNIAKVILYNRSLSVPEIAQVNKVLSLETAITIS